MQAHTATKRYMSAGLHQIRDWLENACALSTHTHMKALCLLPAFWLINFPHRACPTIKCSPSFLSRTQSDSSLPCLSSGPGSFQIPVAFDCVCPKCQGKEHHLIEALPLFFFLPFPLSAFLSLSLCSCMFLSNLEDEIQFLSHQVHVQVRSSKGIFPSKWTDCLHSFASSP